jgi:hypothetical protein
MQSIIANSSARRAGDGDRRLHAERRGMVLVDHDAVEALRQLVDDLILLVVTVVQLARHDRIEQRVRQRQPQ